MDHCYPEHIYEPIRRQIATDFLKRELRKYLPSVPAKAWSGIDTDIASWFDGSAALYPVRDFWNSFWGMAMGFKLEIGLLDFITGENIAWKKEKLNVNDLYFGIKWPCFNPVGVRKYTSVAEVKKSYRDPLIKKEAEQMSKKQPKAITKEDSPIIVTEKELDGKLVLVVYDGNGRLDRAVLDKKKTITAWTGRFTGKGWNPENYWVPTPLLMELVSKAKWFWDGDRYEERMIFENFVCSIRQLSDGSANAHYELKERVLTTSNEKFLDDFWETYDGFLL
ncbi:MAG: hypothetical protein ABID04_01225 [Patescibacteria group bacterium]